MPRSTLGAQRLHRTACAAAASLAVLACSAQAQTITANFAGLSATQTSKLVGYFYAPLDTNGAIGNNEFVEFINGGYAVYSRTGSLLAPAISDATFWLNAGMAADVVNQGLYNTRVKFDPLSQRWFASENTLGTLVNGSLVNNRVLLAVSKTANPLDGWNSWQLNLASSSSFTDYTTLSVDANAVYIGTADFSASGAYNGATIATTPKANLVAASPTLSTVSLWTDGAAPATMGLAPQVVTNYGTGYTGAKVVGVSATQFNRVQVTPLNNTAVAGGVTRGTSTSVAVAYDGRPSDVRQPNTSRLIDGLDRRFSSTIYQVGNKIYAANAVNTTGNGGSDAIHWLVLDATTNAVLQEGLITDGARDLWLPSIAANANGDVVIGYNKSGVDLNIGSYAAVGKTVNGVLSFSSQVLLKSSPVGNYSDGSSLSYSRWGEYSATMVDPTDPNTFWTIQEVATGPSGWGTQISAITVAAAVPEPGTTALLMAGLGVVGWFARRQRAA